MNLTEFLHMGGYGFYVWTSYGIALVVMVVNIIAPARQKKKILADIARKARCARSTS